MAFQNQFLSAVAVFFLSLSSLGAVQAAAPQITSGNLALKNDGTVWTWTWNATQKNWEYAVVVGLDSVTNVATSGTHSVVVKSDGTVWAWGDNASGQLGNGGTAISTIPVQVTGLGGVTAVAVGESNTAALKSDGTVWTWGANSSGQLGNGTTTSSAVPVQVAGLGGIVAIAVGKYNSFALKNDGTTWVWGSNQGCRLGNGVAAGASFVSSPLQVSGLDGITAIAASDTHNLALKTDGSVWAWGDLSYTSAQILPPPGPPYCTPTPETIAGIAGATAIATGAWSSFALKSDGTLLAWGDNSNGQLGNGTTSNSKTPVMVTNLIGAAAIAATGFTSTAMKSDGTIWRWGASAASYLGTGSTSGSSVPVQIPINLGASNMVSNPYQGLWWNPDESGWGLSVTQHGSMIFAAWYTYDQAGLPTWYVMSSCPVSGTACGGDIYQVTGGTPPTAPWNGSGKSVVKVGTGALSFTDADSGTLAFSLNGVAGAKTISRQVFASGSASPAIDYSDLWWNASESGWGVALTQQYGMIFAAWYAYDAAGKPVWYVASSCAVSGNGCAGDLYQVTGGSSPVVPWNGASKLTTKVGTVNFAFADAGSGIMSYTINGASGSREISRQSF